ncbi:MAG: CAP domain-containing protein [Streptosporangiaceae bacterium]|jgi:uncharacterized protein YkwD
MVMALVAGTLYLTRGPAPAVAPSARGTVTSLQTTDACGSARAGACAEPSPIGISTAAVPPGAPPVHPGRRLARPAPSATASPSHSASAPTASTPASAAPSTSASPSATPAGAVLALINAARSAAGLPPLTITAGLDRSASAHNALMAAGCGLSHQCPGEPDLGARETAAGVHWMAAGENIGTGGPVAASPAASTQLAVTLTQDMLNEQPPNDGHRKNILSPSFTHIGIAIYRTPSGTLWLTQDFST